MILRSLLLFVGGEFSLRKATKDSSLQDFPAFEIEVERLGPPNDQSSLPMWKITSKADWRKVIHLWELNGGYYSEVPALFRVKRVVESPNSLHIFAFWGSGEPLEIWAKKKGLNLE